MAEIDDIRNILDNDRDTNWSMPEGYAIEYAQEIAALPPKDALIRAQKVIEDLKKKNAEQKKKRDDSKNLKDELKTVPYSNADMFGIISQVRRWGFTGRIVAGFLSVIWRNFLATLNATPGEGLNVLEVDHEGLKVYLPFSTVSQRKITHKELKENQITISPDPADYFDAILGQLRLFFPNVPIPWGRIVVDERGSGRNIAAAVALRPDLKVKRIKDLLEKLYLLDNPYEGYKRLPRMVDLFIYYDTKNPPAEAATNNTPTKDEQPPPVADQSTKARGINWFFLILILFLLTILILILFPILRDF
jgi:hypothetical protein